MAVTPCVQNSYSRPPLHVPPPHTAQSSETLTIPLSTYLKPRCSLGRNYQTKCCGLVTTVGGTNPPLDSEEGPRLTREATPPQNPPRGWFGECIHVHEGVGVVGVSDVVYHGRLIDDRVPV